jgi:hypothetical protein
MQKDRLKTEPAFEEVEQPEGSFMDLASHVVRCTSRQEAHFEDRVSCGLRCWALRH